MNIAKALAVSAVAGMLVGSMVGCGGADAGAPGASSPAPAAGGKSSCSAGGGAAAPAGSGKSSCSASGGAAAPAAAPAGGTTPAPKY